MIRNSTRKVTHQLYLCGAKIYSFLFLPVKLCHLSPPGLFLYGSLFPGKPWSIERCFWPLRCILNEDSSMHQILHTFHHFLCFTICPPPSLASSNFCSLDMCCLPSKCCQSASSSMHQTLQNSHFFHSLLTSATSAPSFLPNFNSPPIALCL